MSNSEKRVEQITLKEIYQYLVEKGLTVELVGEGEEVISGLSTIQNGMKGTISFVHNPRYRRYLEGTEASAVLVNERNAKYLTGAGLVCDETHVAWGYITQLFKEDYTHYRGIDPTAIIAESAHLEEGVTVGPYAIIGENCHIGAGSYIDAHVVIEKDVTVGKECYFFSHVTVRYNCHIGDRVILNPGAVIGAEGFGFARAKEGYIEVAQLGRVILHDDVNIGANTSIDRGAIEDTVVGRGSKIDNHVQLGHNCTVGENTVIAGYTGIAGSTKIGSNVLIGGGVGVNGHITIEDGAIVTGGTNVSHSLKAGKIYSSPSPMMENREWLKTTGNIKRLGDLFERVRQLEEALSKKDK